jgi:SAM-dependent methyltransferase
MTKPIAEIACRLSRPQTLVIWVFDRFFDRLLDKRFGINSSRRISLSSLGLDAPDRIDYQAISYLDFAPLMKTIEARGTFVDFGCGAGRCVCLASQYPFEHVIGVELSESLCMAARRNVKARGIVNAHIECVDAVTFVIPPEATTFHFFHPFRGETLRTVLANIMRSTFEHPRKITILVCGSPVDREFFEIFNRYVGLKLARQLTLPTGCMGMIFTNTIDDYLRQPQMK